MKKNIIPLLIIVCIILIPFVWDKVTPKTDNTLINSVLDIEKATYDVNNLKISYKEFKSKIIKYCSKYYPSMFESTIYSGNQLSMIGVTISPENQLTEEQCNELSLDDAKKEFDELKEGLKEMEINSLFPGLSYSAIQLSKVYSDLDKSSQSLSFKHIYVKRKLAEVNNTSIYTKYTFVKEANSYILFSVKVMRELDNSVTFGDKIEL